MNDGKKCELCTEEAVVRCEADSANLCLKCDEKVHVANFLVARHARIVLCCECHQQSETTICGPCPDAALFLMCSACSVKPEYCNSAVQSIIVSTHQKDCRTSDGNMAAEEGCMSEISTDEHSYVTPSLVSHKADEEKRHPSTRHVQNADMKVQIILRRWCRDLNLRSSSTVSLAMYLVDKALHKLPGLSRQKFRILLAGALWVAASFCENEVCLPCVKRVEECTGIPSKLILMTESRVASYLNWKMHDEEEGWAESSC